MTSSTWYTTYYSKLQYLVSVTVVTVITGYHHTVITGYHRADVITGFTEI